MNEKKKLANLSLQVIPINCENSYRIVDEAIYVIQKSGVRFEVHPFSTIMEGEINRLIEIVHEAKNASFNAGADELLLNIQIHLKKDSSVTFEEKREKFL